MTKITNVRLIVVALFVIASAYTTAIVLTDVIGRILCLTSQDPVEGDIDSTLNYEDGFFSPTQSPNNIVELVSNASCGPLNYTIFDMPRQIIPSSATDIRDHFVAFVLSLAALFMSARKPYRRLTAIGRLTVVMSALAIHVIYYLVDGSVVVMIAVMLGLTVSFVCLSSAVVRFCRMPSRVGPALVLTPGLPLPPPPPPPLTGTTSTASTTYMAVAVVTATTPTATPRSRPATAAPPLDVTPEKAPTVTMVAAAAAAAAATAETTSVPALAMHSVVPSADALFVGALRRPVIQPRSTSPSPPPTSQRETELGRSQ